MITRYALVRGNGLTVARVAAYLPSNYRCLGLAVDHPFKRLPDYEEPVVVIAGRDRQGGGFGLDDFIMPRLASGCLGCTEIDLSHPVMKQIDIDA